MRLVYAKPPGAARKKRPGRKNGHPGARRDRPDRVDRTLDHRLTCGPWCQGTLHRCHRTRTRYTKDIPKDIQPVITDHHRSYHSSRRLINRLRRHAGDLFTLLDEPGVPFDNNPAERAIRPAVILRKNSRSNRSEHGAETQSVLMSVYRTLKQRGHPPIETIVRAIDNDLSTGPGPPLPSKVAANG